MTGYEIHAGITTGPALARPAVAIADGRIDGTISADRQILGSYCHGLFDRPEALAALLAWPVLPTGGTSISPPAAKPISSASPTPSSRPSPGTGSVVRDFEFKRAARQTLTTAQAEPTPAPPHSWSQPPRSSGLVTATPVPKQACGLAARY